MKVTARPVTGVGRSVDPLAAADAARRGVATGETPPGDRGHQHPIRLTHLSDWWNHPSALWDV